MRSSLAIVIVLALAAAGGIYGYFSAERGHNPYPVKGGEGIDPAQVKLGRAWKPTPVWLPAYVVAVVPRWTAHPKSLDYGIGNEEHVIGFGMENRKAIIEGKTTRWQGWTFTSKTKAIDFRNASIGVGALLGTLVAVVIIAAGGLVPLAARRKQASADGSETGAAEATPAGAPEKDPS